MESRWPRLIHANTLLARMIEPLRALGASHAHGAANRPVYPRMGCGDLMVLNVPRSVKRTFMVLTLALVIAAMMVAMAMPAFADPDCTGYPGDRPASCLTSTTGQEEPGGGPPAPGNFVGPGPT